MKKIILLILFILVVGIGIFLFSKSGDNSTGNLIKQTDDVQEIVLSMKNGNYYPNTITVESGKPVRMTLDDSVRGCYRGFTINDLNVRKYSKSPDDYVEFTPTQKGTYKFACSMGMGTGTLVVK